VTGTRGDAVAVEGGDAEAVISCFDGVAENADTAEVLHDEAAEGVVRLIGQSDASLGLEIAAVQEAVDVEAAAGRGPGEMGTRVVLVADLTDEPAEEHEHEHQNEVHRDVHVRPSHFRGPGPVRVLSASGASGAQA
jgi:hypothetical protein